MTSKEFAIKYANKQVKVYRWKNSNGIVGRVVGYDHTRVVIEVDEKGEAFWFNVVVPADTIKMSTHRYSAKDLEYESDDCDDCGAVADEPCKDNCPNKE